MGNNYLALWIQVIVLLCRYSGCQTSCHPTLPLVLIWKTWIAGPQILDSSAIFHLKEPGLRGEDSILCWGKEIKTWDWTEPSKKQRHEERTLKAWEGLYHQSDLSHWYKMNWERPRVHKMPKEINSIKYGWERSQPWRRTNWRPTAKQHKRTAFSGRTHTHATRRVAGRNADVYLSFWNHPHKGTNSESELIQEGWFSGTEQLAKRDTTSGPLKGMTGWGYGFTGRAELIQQPEKLNDCQHTLKPHALTSLQELQHKLSISSPSSLMLPKSNKVNIRQCSSYFSLIFISYWSIADEQCAGLGCTAKWFSSTYIFSSRFFFIIV